MAFAETTNPDIANQFGATDVAPAQLRAQIESAWKRIGKTPRKPVYYEPQWEDPGLHGGGREVSLRGRARLDEVTGKWQRKVLRLPPAPRKHVGTGETVLIVGLVVGAGALAWYLWKRRPAGPAVHVGEDYCGLDMLGAE